MLELAFFLKGKFQMIKNVFPLSFIVATRFFGLFIVLPMMSIEVVKLHGATLFLAGFSVGIYALFQMILSVPFGYLSDKFGRKITLTIGLLIFIIGCAVCINADDIWTFILGRILQGSGAVGGVAIALISDFTKEESRAKAMSFMGLMIGLSFAIAVAISPVINAKFGFSSLFWLSAILTILCIFLLFFAVEKEPKISAKKTNAKFGEILQNSDLIIINLSNFLQKTFMTTAFFIIPIILTKTLNLSSNKLSIIYIIAMILGFCAMGMAGFLGETKRLSKQILIFGVGAFILAYILFEISAGIWLFCAGVAIFFIGFCVHEPLLQSIASKFAKSSQKGLVLGIFNACGYFGTFCGAMGAGILIEHGGILWICVIVVVVALLWLIALVKMTDPHIFYNIYLDYEPNLDALLSDKRIVDIYALGDKFIIKYNSNLISEDEISANLGTKNGKN